MISIGRCKASKVHELSICQGLLRQLTQIAAQHTQTQVSRISLQIGPLSGVEPDLLRHAFKQASHGSIADGASLFIEQTALRVHCRACDTEQDVHLPKLSCPRCGSENTILASGDELLLVSIGFPTERNDV